MRLLLFASLFLMLCALSAAEPEKDEPKKSSVKELVKVQYVNINLTAVDKKGRYIDNLKSTDIQIEEDEKLQEITDFSPYTSDLPIPRAIGFLLDNSYSMKSSKDGMRKLDMAKESVLRILSTSPPTDELSLLLMNVPEGDSAHTISGRSTIEKTLSSIDVKSGGVTPLLDRMSLLIGHMSEKSGRRFIVLCSDGIDYGSKIKADELFVKIQNADLTVICIATTEFKIDKGWGTAAEREVENGKKLLKRLADETGGFLFIPAGTEDLKNIPLRLETALSSQYFVGYRSTNVDNTGWREIKIKSNRKDIKELYYRKGYFSDES